MIKVATMTERMPVTRRFNMNFAIMNLHSLDVQRGGIRNSSPLLLLLNLMCNRYYGLIQTHYSVHIAVYALLDGVKVGLRITVVRTPAAAVEHCEVRLLTVFNIECAA